MKTNFFVLHEYKLISLGIPKCGQTSLKRAFLGPDIYNVHDKARLDYLDPQGLEERINELRDRGYLTFTFVRNPYDRVISFWRQKVAVPNKFTAGPGHFHQGMNFPATVNTVCQMPDHMSNVHYRSQISMIRIGGQLPDFIGRLESYQEDWKGLSDAIGWKLPDLPWENRTDATKYNSEWTDMLRQRVYLRYRNDFDILGYER